MVDKATALTRNGLRDWLVQRVTAVILAAYLIFLLVYFLTCSEITYTTWRHLFFHPWMQMFTFLTLISLVTHSWVGIWTVVTDYINCAYGRLLVMVIVILALLACLGWGAKILWGV